MTRHFVKVLFDVHCEWQGPAPYYRVYVNDELFTERTYNYTDCYLQEMLQIEAAPGNYDIRCEIVQPSIARLRIENMHVEFGPGSVKGSVLRIRDALA